MIVPDASLARGARIMRDRDLGCLPVIQNGQLIAIVRDGMSASGVLTCFVDHSVDQAHDLMATSLIKHLLCSIAASVS